MASLKSGMGSLRELLVDVKTLSGWAAKGIIAAPLVDVLLGFGPPWPRQLPVITSCAELLTLLLVLSYLGGRSAKALTGSMSKFAAVTGFCFIAYAVLSSQLIFTAPTGERFSSGLSLRPDIAPLITASYTPTEALRDGGWDPEAVWTRGSITAARTAMILVWISMFCSFVACLGIFALRGKTVRHATRDPSAR
ncbi:hypothetical protein BE11_21160 [Sorangium cellulosum]|nr:hypothetical protein BE11_21160 [Sorangium cellulosum]